MRLGRSSLQQERRRGGLRRCDTRTTSTPAAAPRLGRGATAPCARAIERGGGVQRAAQAVPQRRTDLQLAEAPNEKSPHCDSGCEEDNKFDHRSGSPRGSQLAMGVGAFPVSGLPFTSGDPFRGYLSVTTLQHIFVTIRLKNTFISGSLNFRAFN